MVRKKSTQTTLSKECDYEVLLLKRNPNIAFGNLWACPGGNLDPEDERSYWSDVPELVPLLSLHDFPRRMAAIRELYEECNVLLCRQASSGSDAFVSSSDVRTEYKGNFVTFCKENRLVPALDRLFAFRRLIPPLQFKINNTDAQFYLYFVDGPEMDALKMNHDEFTELQWLSPEMVYSKYLQKIREFQIIVP